MDYADVLIRPLISEKATALKEKDNAVVFMVSLFANKIDVKRAVEEAFKVKVSDVKVIRRRPQPRVRMGRVVGRIAGFKKAYVKLAPGEKIEFFEGV